MLEESDLRLLIDLAPTAVLLLRRGDRNRPAPVVQLTNRAFTELAGMTSEAVAGRSLRTLRSLFEGDETFARLATAAQVGEPFSGRLRLRSGTGRTMVVGVRAQGLRQRPENYAIWLDAALAGAPARCAVVEPGRLLSALSEGCFYELAVDLDCRLRLTWADSRLTELTGYEPEELLEAGGFFALVTPADLRELNRRNQRLLAGQGGSVRYRLRRKSGELRMLQDTARPERDPESEVVTRVVGSLTDITRGWADILPAATLERLAAVLHDSLGGCLLLTDVHGRLHWASPRPGSVFADRLRACGGQSLAGLLSARPLSLWLDWLDEALAAPEPLRCRLPAALAWPVRRSARRGEFGGDG